MTRKSKLTEALTLLRWYHQKEHDEGTESEAAFWAWHTIYELVRPYIPEDGDVADGLMAMGATEEEVHQFDGWKVKLLEANGFPGPRLH